MGVTSSSGWRFLAHDFCEGLVAGGGVVAVYSLLAMGMAGIAAFFFFGQAASIGLSAAQQFESAILAIGNTGLLCAATAGGLALAGSGLCRLFGLKARPEESVTFQHPRIPGRTFTKFYPAKRSVFHPVGKVIPALAATGIYIGVTVHQGPTAAPPRPQTSFNQMISPVPAPAPAVKVLPSVRASLERVQASQTAFSR